MSSRDVNSSNSVSVTVNSSSETVYSSSETVNCSSSETVSLHVPLKYDDSLNSSAIVGDSVEISSQNDIDLNESHDLDGDSLISVSDTSRVTTNLQNDTSISDLDISVQYKEGLKCLYTNIDCISNKWTELEALIYLQNPDIVGITEVFSKNQETINLSAYVLEGFQQLIIVEEY